MDKYRIIDGTAYNAETVNGVIMVLEAARKHGTRIRIFYGDTETGRSRMDEWGMMGTVGRSTGLYKIPLLIQTRYSLGGAGILDNCIIRITEARGGEVLYSHPKFHCPKLGITETGSAPAYTVTDENGTEYATFQERKKAERWIDFITGRRNSK